MEDKIGLEFNDFRSEPGRIANVSNDGLAQSITLNINIQTVGFWFERVAFYVCAEQVQPRQQPGPFKTRVAGQKNPFALIRSPISFLHYHTFQAA